MKLTPWFSGDQKPVRAGTYQIFYRNKRDSWYAHWDGVIWGKPQKERFDAHYSWVMHGAGYGQTPHWRGVMK